MTSTSEVLEESKASLIINTEFVKELSALVDKGQFDEALAYLTTSSTIEQHEQRIYHATWDLCTYLFHLAEQPSDKLCNEYEIFAQDALLYVAEHGNAREMLIIMLEQADKFISDHAYSLYIQLSVCVIKRLPLKRSLLSSMNDILSLVRCHLDTLELPTINSDFEGTDLLIFNHDRRVVHLLDLANLYVKFISQLRDHFSSLNENDVFDNNDVRLRLAKNLVALLQGPLAALSFEPIKDQESSSMTAIRPLLDCLFTLSPNPLRLIDNDENTSILVYLLLTKMSYFSLLPHVYSPFFYLLLAIPCVQQMSEDRERVMLIEKACVLVSNVCSRLSPNNEFDQYYLENENIQHLIETLKILMVQSPARQYAPLTIGAYQNLFRAFTPMGRYAFIRQQLAKTSANEDSYRTFLCKLVKDEFLLDYRSSGTMIYKGQSLFQLLDLLCCLPNGVESDLLEIHDCLISSLNFIRFIGLIDKRHVNRTLLWTDRLNHLNEKLMKPLRKSIDLARAHYKLEIKTKQAEKSSTKSSDEQMDTEIVVGDKHLPVPTRQQQLDTMQSALTKFDILDCVLSCISETFGGEL